MPEPRITVLVVAKDEAHNLADCLAAAAWADERVVVVDATSRDATVEIARRDADIVAIRVFDDFAGQRNAALAMATGNWVLSVDADERITPGLAAEIRRVLADPDAPYTGYRVPIRSEILGRRFGFSGTQHDLPLRLFRRDCGRWVGLVHETVALRGTTGTVLNPLRHRTIPTMGIFLEKINTYTTLEAAGLATARRAYRTTDLALRPFWTFFKLYVLKQGFRDGVEGFMFCLLSGVSAAVRAWKHRELTLGGRTP
jgi:glycosyltransferase involved in cell wall biosynthesis